MINIKNYKLNPYSKKRKTWNNSIADNSYRVYRSIRIKLKKFMPLSEYDKMHFTEKSFRADTNNSIPANKYFKINKLYLFDIIAKENIDILKINLKRFINSHPLKRHMASSSDIKEIYNFLDDCSNRLSTEKYWHYIGCFEFNDVDKGDYIDIVSIYIFNFSASYIGIRFDILPSKKFLNDYNKLMSISISDRAYAFFNKKGSLKNGSIWGYGNYPGEIYKSELINDAIANLKYNFVSYIKKYFILELTSKDILLPSINTYKTNIEYSKNNTEDFFRSLSMNLRFGGISQDKRFGLFIQTEDNVSNSTNLIANVSCKNYILGIDESIDLFTQIFSMHFVHFLICNQIIIYSKNTISFYRNKAFKQSQKNKKNYKKILFSLDKMESELFFIRRILNENPKNVFEKEFKYLCSDFNFQYTNKEKFFWNKAYNSIAIGRKNIYDTYNSVMNLYKGFLDYTSQISTFKLSRNSFWVALLSLVIAIISLFYTASSSQSNNFNIIKKLIFKH